MSLEFYMFHLMPYPDGGKYIRDHDSAWVTFPNKYYDPEIGHALYNRYLDELEHAEKLGFDGIVMNEHHQTTYGNMPAPNLIAATLARRTNRVKIALLGNAIPLRDNPLRVAEEVAMLDVITGGRIISGFVRGIGDEYHSMSNVDPTRSRDRFNEAHDLIIKAWTSEEPFSWIGKNYKFRHVNIWPRPLQKPHPEIWIPGLGVSTETMRFVAGHHYTWMTTFQPTYLVRHYIKIYREFAEQEFGYQLAPRQVGTATPVYVAETDERAYEEARPHVEWLFHCGLKQKWEHFAPPGYFSPSALMNIFSADYNFVEKTYEEIVEEEWVYVGSPETVRQKIENAQKEFGIGVCVVMLQIGDMPAHRTLKNMELFATEVIPYFRQEEESPAVKARQTELHGIPLKATPEAEALTASTTTRS